MRKVLIQRRWCRPVNRRAKTGTRSSQRRVPTRRLKCQVSWTRRSGLQRQAPPTRKGDAPAINVQVLQSLHEPITDPTSDQGGGKRRSA